MYIIKYFCHGLYMIKIMELCSSYEPVDSENVFIQTDFQNAIFEQEQNATSVIDDVICHPNFETVLCEGYREPFYVSNSLVLYSTDNSVSFRPNPTTFSLRKDTVLLPSGKTANSNHADNSGDVKSECLVMQVNTKTEISVANTELCVSEEDEQKVLYTTENIESKWREETKMYCEYDEKPFYLNEDLKICNSVEEVGNKGGKKTDRAKRSKHQRSTKIKTKVTFVCEFCFKNFANMYKFKRHRNTHTLHKDYKCEDCKKEFATKFQLERHIRIHTLEKPYKCFHCQKTFSDLSNRNIHLRIHNQQKPYSCSFCHLRFTCKSTLNQHFSIHTGTKRFGCPYCKKCFTTKGGFNRHTRTHTGEKPFTCSDCNRSFGRRCAMVEHVKIHSK